MEIRFLIRKSTGLTFITMGNEEYFIPAITIYNRYLNQDDYRKASIEDLQEIAEDWLENH